MATMYVRRFNFKDDLTDDQVLKELDFLLRTVVPAVKMVPGVRDCRVFSGAGALRADLTITVEMDDGGVYEKLLVDEEVRAHLGRMYGNWDLKAATQTFRREITSELMDALSSRR